MAARKGQGTGKSTKAAGDKPAGPPRARRPWPEQQAVVGQIMQALNKLGATVNGLPVDPDDLRRAYYSFSNRKVAKVNSPEWLKQQLEKVTGKRVSIAGENLHGVQYEGTGGHLGVGVEPQQTRYEESGPLADRVEAGYGE